jgi:hypothetical protein
MMMITLSLLPWNAMMVRPPDRICTCFISCGYVVSYYSLVYLGSFLSQ